MRILIVEDDFASRKFMMNFMSAYGDCDGTVDGMEAVEAYMMALDVGRILRTFKIKKNVEVTDNGKIII